MCIYCRERRNYPSDVSDAEWTILEPLIPTAKPGGRPQEIERREIVNAILYVLRSGCPWRLLPHDLPRWFTVYAYFRHWKRDGTWESVHHALRRQLRVRVGREPEPSAAVVDSQSVKTSPVRGDGRRLRRGKKKPGAENGTGTVDTQGLVICAKVLAADITDRDGAKVLLTALSGHLPRLLLIWRD
jgi:putative transposase